MYDLFSFYRSKEWENLRRIITSERVDRNGDLCCESCKKVIVRRYDAICHHVEELNDGNVNDPMVALNPNNIQVLCHQCHNRVHERFGHPGTRHIYIVWGSPCSGKRAYVDSVADKNDLIIDYDRLYDAVGVAGNRKAVKSNVMAMYKMLTDMVRTRNGKWKTVWIVRGLPLRIDRDLITRELLGGEFIHIDTPREDCEREALRRGGDWKDWVAEYWDRYQPDE